MCLAATSYLLEAAAQVKGPVVEIKLRGMRSPVVIISKNASLYLLNVNLLAVKAFDEPTNLILNKAKGAAYIQLALAKHMKVKSGHVLVISGQRTLSHKAQGKRFQLIQQIPMTGIKQQVAQPKQNDVRKTNGKPTASGVANSFSTRIRGGLLSRKDDLADSIKKYFSETRKLFPSVRLLKHQFHGRLDTIVKITAKFQQRMIVNIDKDKALFTSEKDELKNYLVLSYGSIQKDLIKLDEKYFQIQLDKINKR